MSSFIRVMDDAVKALAFTKFQTYLEATVQNTDCVFAPKSIAQRKIAEKRGESTVEFISVWRTGIRFDWERQNSAIARKGIMLTYDNSSAAGSRTNIVTAKAIPAVADYEITIWSRDLEKISLATEAYLQWIHNSPQLLLNYMGSYPMEMYLKLGQVRDETDYNIYNRGLYFVTTFPITLDGWILSSFSTRTILKIILDVFLREGTSPNYVDTLLEEYEIEATP